MSDEIKEINWDEFRAKAGFKDKESFNGMVKRVIRRILEMATTVSPDPAKNALDRVDLYFGKIHPPLTDEETQHMHAQDDEKLRKLWRLPSHNKPSLIRYSPGGGSVLADPALDQGMAKMEYKRKRMAERGKLPIEVARYGATTSSGQEHVEQSAPVNLKPVEESV